MISDDKSINFSWKVCSREGGELQNIKERVKDLGSSFFIIISESGYERFGDSIKESFVGSDNIHFAKFNGECSKKEIDRLGKEFKEKVQM